MDEHERLFLDSTKSIIGDYIENDYIADKLVVCTKKQINKKNYVNGYQDFSACVRRKMVILSNPLEYAHDDGGAKFPHQRDEVTIDAIIEQKLILKAVLVGYKYLKCKYDELLAKGSINEENDGRDILYLLVLNIIAKVNLEYKFKN